MQDYGRHGFKPYTCPAGILTIGWGHTNASGRAFTVTDIWSQQDCDAAFLVDMQGAEAAVRRLVTVKLTQPQFDALVSFTYNCGAGSLAASTLLKLLNAGDFEGAALEFHKWTHGGGQILSGLVRRRAAEALMFQEVVPATSMPAALVVAADACTPRKIDAYQGAMA
ncbi:MAG: lysozyme [Caulobacteraceae bacterium]